MEKEPIIVINNVLKEFKNQIVLNNVNADFYMGKISKRFFQVKEKSL